MLYHWKVRFLRHPYGSYLWRYWRALRGDDVGEYRRIPDYIRTYTPGRTFADIGALWGIHGEFAFLAEEVGAEAVKAVDVFGPTPEFEAEHQSRGSSVEFILGDASDPETAARIGVVDVVLCAGVLYHHPSPFDLLVALRRICDKTLILRTASIPEVDGLPNAAVYYPMLNDRDRRLWDLSRLGVSKQVGITDAFEPHEGYGNWFWGLTPSCISALLETAGFRVDHRAIEPFSQTFICTPVAVPFKHRLPSENEARVLSNTVAETSDIQTA